MNDMKYARSKVRRTLSPRGASVRQATHCVEFVTLKRLLRVARQQQWQPKWARTITKAEESAEILQGTVISQKLKKHTHTHTHTTYCRCLQFSIYIYNVHNAK